MHGRVWQAVMRRLRAAVGAVRNPKLVQDAEGYIDPAEGYEWCTRCDGQGATDADADADLDCPDCDNGIAKTAAFGRRPSDGE